MRRLSTLPARAIMAFPVVAIVVTTASKVVDLKVGIENSENTRRHRGAGRCISNPPRTIQTSTPHNDVGNTVAGVVIRLDDEVDVEIAPRDSSDHIAGQTVTNLPGHVKTRGVYTSDDDFLSGVTGKVCTLESEKALSGGGGVSELNISVSSG